MEYQVDIGSAQNVHSPKFLSAIHETAARKGVPNKASKIAVFDNLNLRKVFVEIDRVRSLTDFVSTDSVENDYHDQNRDLNLFYKEYVGEGIMNPLLTYSQEKLLCYSSHWFEIRVEYVSLKKTLTLEEDWVATKHARLFLILLRHKEIKMASDGNGFTEIKLK